MGNVPTTLGQKVRYFRKRADMSQMALELEINAAPGMISRIENDQVNPTKETLLAIARALNLNDREKSSLFNLFNIYPSAQEIVAAISEVSGYLENENIFAYLLDDYATFHAASKGFIKLLNTNEYEAQRLIGKSLFEVALNPEYVVKKFLDSRFLIQTLAIELARMRMESNPEEHFPDIFNQLSKYPEFSTILEKSRDLSFENILSANSKIAYFIIKGQKLRFNFIREKLKQNSRFELIEFINPEPYQ